MIYLLLKTIHVLAVVLWVGGMVFAHFFLRPAAAALDPPLRLRLLEAVLARFFAAVAWASLLVLGTGVWMIGRAARASVQAGLSWGLPLDWLLMSVGGTLMVLIFVFIRWVLFRRLRQAIAAQDWPAGGAAMQRIRAWVLVNLVLGVAIIVVTQSGLAG
jgi:uncharacterized membrane protein